MPIVILISHLFFPVFCSASSLPLANDKKNNTAVSRMIACDVVICFLKACLLTG